MDCISEESRERSANGPMGGARAGDKYSDGGQQGGPDVERKVSDDLELIRMRHDEAIANIRKLTSNGAISSDFKLTAGMLKELVGLSNATARELALVHFDSMERAVENNKRVATILRLSETSTSNMWLRLRTSMNEKLVDATAKLQSYCLSMFGQRGGRSADQNLGVSTIMATQNELRGRTERYERRIDTILRKAYRILGRGKNASAQDVMRAVGIVNAQMQVRTRNDMLIRRWEADAEAARAESVDLKAKLADPALVGDERTTAEALLAQSMKDFGHYSGMAHELRRRRNEDSIAWKDKNGKEHKTMCCGWLDGEINKEADLAWKRLREWGFTDGHVNELMSDMRELYDMAERSLVRNHQVSLTQLSRWTEIPGFLPFVHEEDNVGEAATALSLFTPGSLHAMEGTTERPANVWDSLHHFVKRSAYRVSMTKLAQYLYNAHQAAGEKASAGKNMTAEEIKAAASDASGILITPYRNISGMSKTAYSKFMRAVNGGGVVSDIVNAAGEVERVFIRFKPDFKSPDGGRLFTGAQLNNVLNSITKNSDGLNLIGKGTAISGMMYTRFNPGFPILNVVRDFAERAFNMSNRDYVDERGNVLSGISLIPSMIANMPRAFRIAVDSAWGRFSPDLTTLEGRSLDEFTRQGLDNTWLKDLGKDTGSFEKSLDPNSSSMSNGVPYIREAAKTMGSAGRYLFKMIDAYGSVMNNMPAIAQYLALREHGVSASDAGVGVGEMLNNNLTGTWTHALRTLFPFVRPTMQGARALLRSFGLASDAKGNFNFKPRNAATIAVMYAAASSLYAFLRDGFGESEDGVPNLDAISIGTLSTSLPFMPNGEGGYLKLPVPFGMSRIALAFAAGQDRVERGVMSPEDFAFAVVSSIGKQVAASDFPEWSMRENPADWLVQAFAPSLARPIVDVAINRNFAGGPIVRGQNEGDESMEAKSSKGYAATEQWYKDFAKAMFEDTGFDLAPEQVKALMRGYLGGPLKGILAAIEADNPAANEERRSSMQDLGAFFTALGGTMYYGKLRDADRSLYYEAMDKLRRDVRREGVEWNNPELAKARDPDAYRAWRVQQLRDAGWDETKLADLDLMLQLDSELRKSRQKWKDPLTEAFHMDDDGEALKDAFNRKFDEEHEIYKRSVEELNLYHGGW